MAVGGAYRAYNPNAKTDDSYHQGRAGMPGGVPVGGSSTGTSKNTTAANMLNALLQGGSVTGGGGTGGGGTSGGTSQGGAPPVTATYKGTAEVNPQLEEMRKRWQNLQGGISSDYAAQMAKTADPSAALAASRDATAFAMKQAQANAGNRGLGSSSGILNSQRFGILDTGARDLSRTGVEFANEALKRQDALLNAKTGGLTGAYAGEAGTTGQEAANQLAANELGQKSWQALLEDATRRQQIAAGTASSQLDALIRLAGMI
jgi:hypothetical protein